MKNKFLFILFFIFYFGFISAVAITDDLHLNIQTTDTSGNIVTGTFDFVFNISDTSDCSNIIYTNSTSLTTDSRGIISYYLPNVSLDYDQQYWLCYYRDTQLISNSKIARIPYAFRGRNITLSGVEVDANFNATDYNITNVNYGFFDYLGSLASRITKLFVININVSNNVDIGGNLTVDTDTLFVDSNTNMVGIGTGSPSSLLHISGDAWGNLKLEQTVNNTSNIAFIRNGTNRAWIGTENNVGNSLIVETTGDELSIRSEDDIFFSAGGGNARMVIDKAAGNVGIGTTSPSQKLDVVGAIQLSDNADSNEAGTIRWTGTEFQAYNGTDWNTFGTTGGGASIWSQNESAIYYNNGNVGIGTSSPGSLLHLNTATATSVTLLTLESDINNANEYNEILFKVTGGLNYGAIRSHVGGINDSYMTFATTTDGGTLVQHMTIDYDGYVGIGTNNPGRKLDIEGTVSVYMEFDATDYSQFVIGSESRGFVIYDDTTNDYRMVIQNGSGNVGIGTTSPAYKLEVADVEKALNVSSVLYVNGTSGNVGIGTISPTSKLEVNGTIFIKQTTINLTLAQNDITFNRPGSTSYINQMGIGGNLAFRTSNVSEVDTTAMFIQDDGKVGIGTMSPSDKLHVYEPSAIASMRLDSGTTNANLFIEASSVSGTGDPQMYFIGGGTGSHKIYSDTSAPNKPLYFYDYNSSGIMMTLNSGKVGIGTTSPDTLLQLSATSTDVGLTITDTAFVNWYIGTDSSDDSKLKISKSNVPETNNYMTIDRSGRVGIGLTNPSTRLHVKGTGALAWITSEETTAGSGILDLRGVRGAVANQDVGRIRTWWDGNNVAEIRMSSGHDSANKDDGHMYFLTSEAGSSVQTRMTIEPTGNVGIGTTGPLAKLQIGDNVASQTDVTHILSLGAGGWAAPTDEISTTPQQGEKILFFADANTKISMGFDGLDMWWKTLSASGGDRGFTWYTENTAGTLGARMRIDEDGNVGIGTASPGAVTPTGTTTPIVLEIKASTANGDPVLRLVRQGDDVVGFDLWQDGGSATHDIHFDNRYELSDWVFTSGTRGAGTTDEIMRIEGTGNVGIGTASPAKLLHINGTDATFRIQTGDEEYNTIQLVHDDSKQWQIAFRPETAEDNKLGLWYYNGSDFTNTMTLLSTGNVGIGTASPDSPLHIVVTAAAAVPTYSGTLIIDEYDNSLDADGGIEFRSRGDGAGYGWRISSLSNAVDLVFESRYNSATWTEKMRILNNGNVGIGTASPGSKLHLAKNGAGNLLTINDYSAPASGAHTGIVFRHGPSGQEQYDANISNYLYGDGKGALDFTAGGSKRVTIRGSGNVGIGTASPNAKLQISTDIWFKGNTTIFTVRENAANMYAAIIEQDQADGYGLLIRVDGAENDEPAFNIVLGKPNSHLIGTNLFNVMGSGNVGIGTTSPWEKLTVMGNIAAGDIERSQCPTGWVLVPGNSDFVEGDFCVMKYEAKQDANKKVVSQASGIPFSSLSWYEAKNACKRVGAHLCTEGERMTIARNIEATTINDIDNDAGLQLATGHSDGAPGSMLAVTSGADPIVSGCTLTETMENSANIYSVSSCEIRGDGSYNGDELDQGFDGTAQAWSATGYVAGGANKAQLRSHVLSNGEIIWDFAGNAAEWTDALCGVPWNTNIGWIEWNNAGLTDWEKYVAGPSGSLTSTNGAGQYYGCAADGNVVERGGHWQNGARAGVFSADLSDIPAYYPSSVGIRCCS